MVINVCPSYGSKFDICVGICRVTTAQEGGAAQSAPAIGATTPTHLVKPTRLVNGNVKGFAGRFLGGTCGLLSNSCGRPEPPRRDADEPHCETTANRKCHFAQCKEERSEPAVTESAKKNEVL
jgi:hypothetical protein